MSFIDTIMHLPEDIRNAFRSLEMRVEALEMRITDALDPDKVTPMETPVVDPSHVVVVPGPVVESVAPVAEASKDAPEATTVAPAPDEKK